MLIYFNQSITSKLLSIRDMTCTKAVHNYTLCSQKKGRKIREGEEGGGIETSLDPPLLIGL